MDMSSLKTSLNADDFEAPALNNDGGTGSQAPTQAQPQQNQSAPQQGQQSEPKHEAAIPYPRFQEVTHENQSLRQQVAAYEQRLQQVQQQQQAPPQSLSGMQAPPPQPRPQTGQLTQQQQQYVDSFRAELEDSEKSKEWQRRIAKEGPKALQDFVDRAIQDTGSRLLGDAIRPLLEKVALIEGDYVSNTLNQYASNVNDPEFGAYRHLFENAVRSVAPNNNIRDPQVLDTIRYWAQAQYKAQYGQAPQQPQQQQFQQSQQFAPPISERPGSPYGFSPQAPQTNKFSRVDEQMAQKFGLDPAQLAATRARTVRGG